MHRISTDTGRGCADPATKLRLDGSPMFVAKIDAIGAEIWEVRTSARGRVPGIPLDDLAGWA